jgi:TonB family protein
MYFDFEDDRPDIAPVGSAISWREGVLLSIVLHLVGIIVLLTAPEWVSFITPAQTKPVEAKRVTPKESPRFVFIQPRIDTPARKPPPRAEASDQDREARQLERAKKPTNPLPYSRGNSPERVEQSEQQRLARGQGPRPEPAPPQAERAPEQQQQTLPLPESQSALQVPASPPTASTQNRATGSSPMGGGRLGDALRNLGRYVQSEQFDNVGGDSGAFGPAIQFDTKGVEFGPWIRRFIAQVKRNWLIPYAAMGMKGHVVITFNVHKDGSISDLSVVGPSVIEAFNNAAFGALASSNPTQPLPPEYPTEKAFFTVTFFYNEQP